MRVFVEVFRTDIPGRRAAARVLRALRARWPAARITLDLADCDRILRVQTTGYALRPEPVAAVLAASGYLCVPLPDDDDDHGVVPQAPACLCSPSNNSAN